MTREVFDRIAPGWYNFRHWSIFRDELEFLAGRWRQGRLLNVGCAHGPDFLPFKDNFILSGVDFSGRMLEFARTYSAKFDFDASLLAADVVHLPFADGVFDWAISVATYHHIKDVGERQSALAELGRVLKPGGEAFITVWNRWQPRFWLSDKEVSVPWRTKGETFYRYYYLFSRYELKDLAGRAGFQVLGSAAGNTVLSRHRLFSRNICLLVRKE